MTTPAPVTGGSGILCYHGLYPNITAQQCFRHETMCGYLLSDDGGEHGSCYDPVSNHGQYSTPGQCYDGVDIEEEEGHSHHGRFCVCDGERQDLCNGDFFKNDPNNSAFHLTTSFTLSIVLCILSKLF